MRHSPPRSGRHSPSCSLSARVCQTSKLLTPCLLLAAALLHTAPASAYCRTTTCDPKVTCDEDPEQCCVWSREGCDTNGIPITWQNTCASYSIYAEDSFQRELSSDDLNDAVGAAFDVWLSVDCGLGAHPSISANNYGLSYCGEPSFNKGSRDANSNVWMYRDQVWSHEDPSVGAASVDASTLALTTVTFNWKTGEILDADVELNTAEARFTNGDSGVDIDLASIVQHESGHFLGLDHSISRDATMASGYSPGSVAPRTLTVDDEEAICAAYPQERETIGQSCQAYGVYSQDCQGNASGCSVGPAPVRLQHWVLAFAGSLFGLMLLRRRGGTRAPAMLRRVRRQSVSLRRRRRDR